MPRPGQGEEKLRLITIPREVSAAGMLLLSGLGGLAIARPEPAKLAAAMLILLLHFLTFDAAFYSLRARNKKLFAIAGSINLLPYLAMILLWPPPSKDIALLGLALAILLVHLGIEKSIGPGTEAEYIYGAAIPVLPALTLPAALGSASARVLLYWIALTIYAVATAAYIEAKLPWRRVHPWLAPAIFYTLWLLVAVDKYMAIALIEPSITYTAAAIRPRKINPKKLKRLGRITFTRLVLFAVLALFAAKHS